MLHRGFLYWADLDKRRPALVLSSDRFNSRSSYVTVVPCSSRLRPLVTHLKLTRGEGGIARPSMLLCEHIQEVPQSELNPTPLGPPLTTRRMREVEDAVLLVLGIDRG